MSVDQALAATKIEKMARGSLTRQKTGNLHTHTLEGKVRKPLGGAPIGSAAPKRTSISGKGPGNATPRAGAEGSTPRAAGTPRAGGAAVPKLEPSSTPRKRASTAGGATPRAMPGVTPRGGYAPTPRAKPGETDTGSPRHGPVPPRTPEEIAAAAEQPPSPPAPLGRPRGYLAQPEAKLLDLVREQQGKEVAKSLEGPPQPAYVPSHARAPLSSSEAPPKETDPKKQEMWHVWPVVEEGAPTREEVKRPVREDGHPSRHSIPAEWSTTMEPQILFNCSGAKCVKVDGDFSPFGDSQEGHLKAVHPDQEVLGRVIVSRSKGEPFMSRVEFRNKWLVGDLHGLKDDGLNTQATIDASIEWKKEDGSKGMVRLRLFPWLAYACAAGSRLKISQPGHPEEGSCCTVQRILPEDDRCVVRIDVLDKEAIVDPRPDTVIRTSRPGYSKGDHLVILQKAALRDAVVLEWLASTPETVHRGGRHRVRFWPLDTSEEHLDGDETEDEIRDLNDFNHAVQHFPTTEAYDGVRHRYCGKIVESEDKVEDAITGNELRIEDQLICVKAQNLGDILKRSEAAWTAIADVQELVTLLLRPSTARSRGVHLAQPTLVRAGPGTGKTWMVKQAAYSLAKHLSAPHCDKCKGVTDRPIACAHFGIKLVPVLVYVQRIVRMVREQGEEAEIFGELLRTRSMLPWYIENNFEGEERQMLLQALEMRALVVLIDGIDEAAGMKEAIEEFLMKEASVSGNRLVVTSRPEGVRLDLYLDRFIVINLLPLSDEQQRRVINSQMQGNVFFDHLMSLSVIRRGQDVIYDDAYPAETKPRLKIEALRAEDKFLLADAAEASIHDPELRQRALSKDRVVGEKDAATPISSATLTRLDRLMCTKPAAEAMAEEGKDAGEGAVEAAPASDGADAEGGLAALKGTLLWALEASLRDLPSESTEAVVRAMIEQVFLEQAAALKDATPDELKELNTLCVKLSILLLKRRCEVELKAASAAEADAKANPRRSVVGAASAAPGTPRQAPAGTPRQVTALAVGTPRRALGSKPSGGATPRAGAGGSTPRKAAASPATPRAADPDAAAAAQPRAAAAAAPSRAGRMLSVVTLWRRIVSRTDEMYVAAESMLPAFTEAAKGMLSAEELPEGLLEVASLKDPVRLHEKAVEECATRYAEGVDGLPEAGVVDVLRAKIACTNSAQVLQIAERLQKGFKTEAVSMTLMRLQNNFVTLNPTHFRHLVFHVCVERDGFKAYGEVQVHHQAVVQYDAEQHSDMHYEFFRSRLRAGAGRESINAVLERVLLFLIEASGVPVLLSLLVLVFTTTSDSGEEDLEMLPQSAYELYSMATQSAVVQRLLLSEGADLKTEEEGTKRERVKNKSNQGGAAADWRSAVKQNSTKAKSADDLTEEETYEMYRRTAKILNLLAQGRFGLSELKQRYVPKGKLKAPMDKLLEMHTKKTKRDELEDAGMNMLRLIAVDNQKNGRREFSSYHVSQILSEGNEMVLALWLRLDTEEAGVTLIKTLESLTDSAPAMYQFKHLSFQEGLFARDLLGQVDRKQWKGWETDETGAAFLNNAYMNNVCRISAGELGRRLAKERPHWNFEAHKLSWIGKSALWQLVNDNPHLCSISLPGNEVGPGTEGGDTGLDATGLKRLFASCPKLMSVNLGGNKLGSFSLKVTSSWAKALATNQTITELDLSGNHFGQESMSPVCRALQSCAMLRSVDLSHNQPGRNPEALIQLVREHKTLTGLSVIEADERHLSSKAKTLMGEAMLANSTRKLAYVSCDSFSLTPTTMSLKWTSTLPADMVLLAGALRSNPTLTSLNLEGMTIAESERTELGKALLENANGQVGLCDEFDLGPNATELEWDFKDSSKQRKGTYLLFGVLRANAKLTKVTLHGVTSEMMPLLGQAMRANQTIQTLVMGHQVQTLKNLVQKQAQFPVQDLTGHTNIKAIDLSEAGELSKPTCQALGALLAKNTCITSLRLSRTQLGDDGGSILEYLDDLCKSGPLAKLDLSEIGLTDRGGRKLFDQMMSGEYQALTSLIVAGNDLRDPKANGLHEMLRSEECALTELDISKNPINGTAVMRALKMNTSLTYLNVTGNELDDDGLKGFAGMLLQPGCPCPIKLFTCDDFEINADTKQLSFAEKALSPSILSLLFGILKLNETVTSLDLSGTGLDGEAARALETALGYNKALTKLDLKRNPKLWQLNAAGEVESADGVEALAKGLLANSTVGCFYVDEFEMQVSTLKGAEGTTTLDLSSQKALSGISAVLVTLLVEQNPTLTHLNLSSNSLPRLGHAMGRCLTANKALVEVILRQAELKDEGVVALASGLQQNPATAVAHLDLYGNGFGPSAAASLADLMSANTSLRKLDLGNNGLGADGTATLAAMLGGNTTLTCLSLHDNSLEEAGASILGEALKKNSTLSTVWLGKNNIKNEGLKALVDGVIGAKESKIAQLDLQNNGLSATGLKPLVQLLAESTHLTALSIAGTRLEFTDTESLQTAAKEKPELGRSKAVRLWTGRDNSKWPDF